MKRYIIHYVSIVFAVVLGLSIAKAALELNFHMVPFEINFSWGLVKFLFNLILQFLYVLAVIALLIYVNEKILNEKIKIPFFKGFKEPKVSLLNLLPAAVMTVMLIVFIYFYRNHGSIFAIFLFVNENITSWFGDKHKLLSLLLIILFSIDVVTLYINAFYNSDLLNVGISIGKLAVLGVLFREIFNVWIFRFEALSEADLQTILTAAFTMAFITATIVITIEMIKSLINISIRLSEKVE